MPLARIAAFMLLLAAGASAQAAKRKAPPLPVVRPESVPQEKIPASKPEAAETGKSAAFEELSFNRTIVIEGKVEKPQVTFTLLKEPPPEKEIRFETSFLENILKLNRENTFSPGETYGRE